MLLGVVVGVVIVIVLPRLMKLLVFHNCILVLILPLLQVLLLLGGVWGRVIAAAQIPLALLLAVLTLLEYLLLLLVLLRNVLVAHTKNSGHPRVFFAYGSLVLALSQTIYRI